MYDVIIIGGGPAGISAAIYCKRSNLNVCIIDKNVIGGNLINYSEIENYPGFGKIETFLLVEKLREHLNLFDIPVFEFENIIDIDLENKIIKTEDNEFQSKYIIIATGSKPKMLNVPGELKYIGKGVHYCAICDGPLYKDKNVAVIGGGNSACEEALGLSKICQNVHIIEFTNKLNADKITLDKIYNTNNISVSVNTKVIELFGNDKLSGIEIENNNIKSKLNFDGVFVYIGMNPNLPKFNIKNNTLTISNSQYIIVNENMETSIPNVYAIGDIISKKYRQVVTAINDGAVAAIHISKQLN